jgi:aspartyl-tRNA(Asn)/glutamyl-tRNA(Gln) amidotransferase subunit C
MKIERASRSTAEDILKKFEKALEDIPELEETHYIVDNVNLTRPDRGEEKNPEKILKNAHLDENGNIIVEKSKWVKQ